MGESEPSSEYPFEVHLTSDGATSGWGAFVHRDEAQAAAVAKGQRDGCEVYGYRAGEQFSTNVLEECVVFYIVVDEA